MPRKLDTAPDVVPVKMPWSSLMVGDASWAATAPKAVASKMFADATSIGQSFTSGM
jgi:hypothetical protein